MSILFSHFFVKINEIRPQEADFTEVLCSIAVKPKKLYFYGKMPEKRLKMGTKNLYERPPVVAIVGTRKMTKYGEEVAYNLAYEAARRGAVVVSGLARGIDGAAHRGAVAANGISVGVLGTPIDRIYPREHCQLAAQMLEKGGVIMSEVAPGAQYHHKACFLERNRLISGLADVVVVVEAAERSGALNTAMHALEQGREVLAVPGDITRPLSRGCNRLINQGAMAYTGPEDVLSLLFPAVQPAKRSQAELLFGDNREETAILRVLAEGIQDGERIIEVAQLSAAEYSRTMTMLEIKGRVRALGANRWMMV